VEFKIGDIVKFKTNDINNINIDIVYDMKKSYTIVNIKGNDIFLDIDPIRPLYKFRFLLDIKGLRKMKLKKLS
jgi:hypothetical protein